MTDAANPSASWPEHEDEDDVIRVVRGIEAANARDLDPVPAGTIVVGDDGSPSAGRSLEFALDLAERLQAPVVVVQSWSIDTGMGWLSDGQGSIRSFAEVTSLKRDHLRAVRSGMTRAHPTVSAQFRAVLAQPADALVDLSGDALMLVIGSRGLGVLGGVVLGSVGNHCLRHARCPVLVVPHHDTD
ncbi:MAG: universal stress protein [Acidobacteria bacterium]|nr:universal stress protein [Acidobacteriota bacterium]